MTLKQLRTGLGLTQKQMGEALGIEKQTYADLERGRYIPSGSRLIHICETFMVTATVYGDGRIEYKAK